MRSLLLFLFLSLGGNVLLSQEIDVKDVKMNEFPNYSGNLWVRNPNGIDSSAVIMTENDKPLKVNFQSSINDKASENKSVLFLVLNHQAYPDRTKWYKDIIEYSIRDKIIKQGDEFAIQSFDCNRPEYGDKPKQLLFPEEPSFTGDENELRRQLNAVGSKDKFKDGQCRTIADIYGALHEALKGFDSHSSELPKAIVVFADDWSIMRQVKEDIIDFSRKTNIPIYAVTYYQNIQRKFGVEQICDETYGLYYLSGKNNDPNLAKDKLFEFMDAIPIRAAGKIYPFTFSTSAEKGKGKQSVKVKYKSIVSGFEYSLPALTLMEWVESNLVLVIGLLVCFIIIVIIIVRSIKRRREKERVHRELQEQELKRIEDDQKRSEAKAEEQEKMIKGLKNEALLKEQLEVEKKQAEELEKINNGKLIQMRSKGNLPWITFDHLGTRGSFEIDHPQFTIGRSTDNSYQLNIPIVSSKHLIIEFENGIYTVTDLKSTNGTYLNGDAISSAQLNHGDVIIVGDINLTFHI